MRSWLKDIRVERGYTQSMVAEKAGISRPFYAQIEGRMAKNMRPHVAKSIGNVLKFDWTLFYDQGNDI